MQCSMRVSQLSWPLFVTHYVASRCMPSLCYSPSGMYMRTMRKIQKVIYSIRLNVE